MSKYRRDRTTNSGPSGQTLDYAGSAEALKSLAGDVIPQIYICVENVDSCGGLPGLHTPHNPSEIIDTLLDFSNFLADISESRITVREGLYTDNIAILDLMEGDYYTGTKGVKSISRFIKEVKGYGRILSGGYESEEEVDSTYTKIKNIVRIYKNSITIRGEKQLVDTYMSDGVTEYSCSIM